jgi:hypothetical protein
MLAAIIGFALVLAQDRPSPEWLPLLDAPKNLGHVLTIPASANAGQRMELTGRVLKSDGTDPFPPSDLISSSPCPGIRAACSVF